MRTGGFQVRSVAAALDAIVADGRAQAVVSGLGGVGKTQMVAALARRTWLAGEVDVLIWVSATSRDAIVSRYVEALGAITGASHDDPRLAVERLLTWMEDTDRRWMVVIDDLTDPADLKNLWPPSSSHGRTIVTTRRRDAALASPERRLIPVGAWIPTEAREYLDQALDGDATLLAESDDLAADLGHLPLALAQAVAYIRDRGLTCSGYRLRWADRRRRLSDLLPEPGALPDDHDTTIATTWSMSIDLANGLNPAGLAGPVLEIASVLDANSIPVAVLTSAPALPTSPRVPGVPSSTWTRRATRSLYRLNLADLATDGPTPVVRVHALIQRSTRESLTARQLTTVAHAAADSIMHLLSGSGVRPASASLLRNNSAVLRRNTGAALLTSNVHPVLIRLGRGLCRAGMLSAATDLYGELLADSRRILGPDHPDTLLLRSDTAWVQGESGDISGALDALSELIPDMIRVCGPDHRETLSARQLMARWQTRTGDLDGSIAAHHTLLADCIRILGPDDPLTLFTRHNLAFAQGHAGNTADARTAFTELLEDRLRVLGPDDRATLLTRHNLAWLRAETGDPQGAADDFRQLIADSDRALGPDHPATLAVRHDLARLRGELGDLAGAISAGRDLLTDCLRILGPHHPATLFTRHNLARWQAEAGEPAAAVVAFTDLLTDRLRLFGPSDPAMTLIRQNLARWQRAAEGEDAPGPAEDETVGLVYLVRAMPPARIR